MRLTHQCPDRQHEPFREIGLMNLINDSPESHALIKFPLHFPFSTRSNWDGRKHSSTWSVALPSLTRKAEWKTKADLHVGRLRSTRRAKD